MVRRHNPNDYNNDYNARMAKHTAPSDEVARDRRLPYDLIIIAVLLVVAYLIFNPKLANRDVATQTMENQEGEVVLVDFPIITEVMTSNKNAYPAVDGEYYDWVEVYNPTEVALNLSGFTLTDNIEQPARYVFPNVMLQPGEFYIVFLSGKAIDAPNHGEFKLSSSGEELILFDAHSNQLDYVKVPHLPPNASYAREIALLQIWEESQQYTPGFYNDETGWEAYNNTRFEYGHPVMINEVMPSNVLTLKDCDDEYVDWVEIINTSEETMVLTGYALSDSQEAPRDWIFPYCTIEPGELLVVYLSGKDKVDDDTGEIHTDFKLNAMDDMLLLSNVEGKIIDRWSIKNMEDDKSMGRMYGSPDTVQIYSHPTPGYENTEDGYVQFETDKGLSSDSPIIISEVMIGNTNTLEDNYGDSPDWIELHNISDERQYTDNLYLTDDTGSLHKWKLPDDFFIEPDGYKVVYASGKDQNVGTTLHTNFSLSATGETVILTNGEGEILDYCVLAPMPYDVSYGRTSAGTTFQYMLYATPEEPNGIGWSGFAPDPILQQKGGMYVAGSVISIDVPSGTKVYYTTDCSEPTEASQLYQGPIQLNNTTVIRAKAFEDGKLPSNTIVTTYFIGVEHDLPVVSISSDPLNLFSDHSGIYAFGDSFDKKKIPFKGANFNEDWEVEGYVEMYDIDGTQTLDQGIGLRIFGAFSRAEIKKSFTLVARSQYGASSIEYPIFPDQPYEEYKSVVLRPGASEWYSSMVRDSLLTSLVTGTTDLDVQAYNPAVVYLNGEYWGVYFFREKLNKYYLEQHKGIDPENVDIIYGNGTSDRHARAGTNNNWLELRAFVQGHDLSIEENYQIVDDWVDIENYMDMVINEIYCGNQDTGNIKCYRENVEGAKWRWFYYDVDWGFFYTTNANAQTNNLVKYINDNGHGAGGAFENWLIMGLLENDNFKRAFIDRFAYHIKYTYDPDRVIEKIEEIYELLDAEMPQDREHWNNEYEKMPVWYKELAVRNMSYESWAGRQKSRLIDFANQRPTVMQGQLVDFFDIDEAWEEQLFPN